METGGQGLNTCKFNGITPIERLDSASKRLEFAPRVFVAEPGSSGFLELALFLLLGLSNDGSLFYELILLLADCLLLSLQKVVMPVELSLLQFELISLPLIMVLQIRYLVALLCQLFSKSQHLFSQVLVFKFWIYALL